MNSEQKSAFEEVKRNHNIFITGSAGTGKSFTLEHIIKWARDEKKHIAVTASTGSSSYLIRGRTIHSYLGIGLAKKSASELAEYVKYKKPFIVKKVKSLDILILDEVSMINSELLDKIDKFLSIIRGSSKSFGGVQVILCGDFCQLPPIEGKYSFNAECWSIAKIKTISLTKQMRQNNDETFKLMLEELRWGICSDSNYKKLRSLKNTKVSHGIIPTILYSMNIDVDKINSDKFKSLIENGAKTLIYKTKLSSSNTSTKFWVDSYKIPETLELCVGAQVMLTWNISQDNGLINGSRGIVTELTTLGPRVKFVDGNELIIESFKLKSEECEDIWVSFMPIKLAWATTIHKSQGMTLDAVVIDLGKSIFEYGQAYTALSRVRNLDSVVVLDISKKSFKTHKDVLEFYGKIIS